MISLFFPRSTRVTTLSAAALALTIALSAVGCAPADGTRQNHAQAGSTGLTTAATTTTAAGVGGLDFAPLLLPAADLSDTDDTFALRETRQDPNGLRGASALFVNQDDTRAISVTIAGYPDAAVATATLHQAIATAGRVVTGADPAPLAVGTDGTVIRGSAPDGSKAVTLVLFTQGPVLARLEFDSATDDHITDDYVTDIARMQQIALRVGIPDDAR